jgi:hypothetical protein
MSDEFATVPLLCPYSAQDYANNTDNGKNAKLPSFPELVDFSVSDWLLMLYSKVGKLFLDDFKSQASGNIRENQVFPHNFFLQKNNLLSEMNVLSI